jgi:hypothetical protein
MLELSTFLAKLEPKVELASLKVFLIILTLEHLKVKYLLSLTRLKVHGSAHFFYPDIFLMPRSVCWL